MNRFVVTTKTLFASCLLTAFVVGYIYIFFQPDWEYYAFIYGGGTFFVMLAVFYAGEWWDYRCKACGTAWALSVQGEQDLDHYSVTRNGNRYRRRIYIEHTLCGKCGETRARKRTRDEAL